jgi:hypothetical protein
MDYQPMSRSGSIVSGAEMFSNLASQKLGWLLESGQILERLRVKTSLEPSEVAET